MSTPDTTILHDIGVVRQAAIAPRCHRGRFREECPVPALDLPYVERILSGFTGIRDFVVFTDKRLIAVNVQGMTGTTKDLTSLPYSETKLSPSQQRDLRRRTRPVVQRARHGATRIPGEFGHSPARGISSRPTSWSRRRNRARYRISPTTGYQ
ncbi:PH domain-containing protein [Prauserella oleivorans]|uniref:PH domain-containing protein n=1 Tax=Prauserella oleivorans TaxID=1478153 RepID=A0ABW5WCG2_9PSEU